jgi:hypothetical protein
MARLVRAIQALAFFLLLKKGEGRTKGKKEGRKEGIERRKRDTKAR